MFSPEIEKEPEIDFNFTFYTLHFTLILEEVINLNNDMVSTIMMLVFAVVFFYVFMVMPQKKREKQVQQMMNSLKVGDDIVTIGGILGKIIHIGNDVVTIEASAEKTKINITKRAIAQVLGSKDE